MTVVYRLIILDMAINQIEHWKMSKSIRVMLIEVGMSVSVEVCQLPGQLGPHGGNHQ